MENINDILKLKEFNLERVFFEKIFLHSLHKRINNNLEFEKFKTKLLNTNIDIIVNILVNHL